MRFSIARVLSFAAVAAFASTGLMQGAVHNTFHLSTETHWGNSVLEPGDYAIDVPVTSLGRTQLLVHGAGKIVFEVPLTQYAQKNSDSNYLKLSKIDGEYFISEFSSGATGQTFTFSVPKAKHHQLTARGNEGNLALAVK